MNTERRLFALVLFAVVFIASPGQTTGQVTQDRSQGVDMTSYQPVRGLFLRRSWTRQAITQAVDSARAFLKAHPNTIHHRTVHLDLFSVEKWLADSCDSLWKEGKQLLSEYSSFLTTETVAEALFDRRCDAELVESVQRTAVEGLVAQREIEDVDVRELFILGHTLVELDQTEQAITFLEVADSLANEAQVGVRWKLAEALDEEGEDGRAIAIYRELLARYPANQLLQERLSTLIQESGKTEADARAQVARTVQAGKKRLESLLQTPTAEGPQAASFPSPPSDSVRITSMEGSTTVIGFWAPWCGLCTSQLAFLAGLPEEYPGEIRVVGVAFDPRHQSALEKQIEQAEWPVHVEGDPELRKHLLVDDRGLPETAILDQNGKLLYTRSYYGRASPIEDEIRRAIEMSLISGGEGMD